jgi:hypothetical protein
LAFGIVPLGAAHRAQQNRVGGLAQRRGLRRQRRARLVDGAPADDALAKFEIVSELARHRLQGFHAFGRDLGSNAVAWENCNRGFHGRFL